MQFKISCSVVLRKNIKKLASVFFQFPWSHPVAQGFWRRQLTFYASTLIRTQLNGTVKFFNLSEAIKDFKLK